MTQKLETAILDQERQYSEALDRLRELSTDETENEVYELTFLLREAVELVRCARRLSKGRTAREIHDAFGAPGDFGYGSPIGDALYSVYRRETSS